MAFAKLMEAIRIAIWDRKKIIVAFATFVWGVNIAFLIQGKSLLPCFGVIKSPVQMWCGIRCYTGEYSSTHYLFEPTGFIDRSLARRGT